MLGLQGLHGGVSAQDLQEMYGFDGQGKVLAEYVWLGGSATDLRSKTKVLDFRPATPDEAPVIVVDGSASGQASSDSYEVYLKPRKLFKDPFRGGDHLLILCDTFQPPKVEQATGHVAPLQPHPTNNRVPCENVMKKAAAHKPVFAVEQEFAVLNPSTNWPVGWPANNPAQAALAKHEQLAYCGPAANAAAPTSGRDLSEAHLRHCLKAGVRISGSSAASSPGQWSFKIGPCEGIDLADELWTSRYILQRLSEKAGKHVTFDPCPIPGDWSPAGCFVKFSTSGTRDPSTGLAAIEQQVLRLQASHVQHMIAYGQGSLNKLLSQDPNASVFSCAGANKAASVVVPSKTLLSRAGYYVDRRPSSNMDPYLVTMLLVASALDVPLPTGGAAPTAAVAAAASAPAASQPIPTPRHSGLAAAKLAQQQQLALAAAAGRGHSACSGLSYSHSDGLLSADADTRSMSSHQLLLDELYKRDGFAPDTPPMLAGAGFSACIESSDESCSSDGTSPERESPLGAALLHGDAEGMVY